MDWSRVAKKAGWIPGLLFMLFVCKLGLVIGAPSIPILPRHGIFEMATFFHTARQSIS